MLNRMGICLGIDVGNRLLMWHWQPERSALLIPCFHPKDDVHTKARWLEMLWLKSRCNYHVGPSRGFPKERRRGEACP